MLVYLKNNRGCIDFAPFKLYEADELDNGDYVVKDNLGEHCIVDRALCTIYTGPVPAGFILWGGGEIPVNADTRVEVFSSTGVTEIDHAECYNWLPDSDIIAYRIVEEDSQPLSEKEGVKSDEANPKIFDGLQYVNINEVTKLPALLTQQGGTHYKDMAIQPIEFIVANNLEYRVGNVIKYACRHKNKNGAEDIRKAIHYLEMILETDYACGRLDSKDTPKDN